jgi:hypothetical protein
LRRRHVRRHNSPWPCLIARTDGGWIAVLTIVAERRNDGSRAFQRPETRTQGASRRGATLAHGRCRSASSRQASLRDADSWTLFARRGLKSTATITSSLRDGEGIPDGISDRLPIEFPCRIAPSPETGSIAGEHHVRTQSAYANSG